MPELPEVETIVQELAQVLPGRLIKGTTLLWEKTFKGKRELLKGKKIISVSRRGKYIVIELDKGFFLMIHLRMTGRFLINSVGNSHERFQMALDPSLILSFIDTRKFGRITLTTDRDVFFKNIGIEPFDKSLNLKTLFSKTKKSIKGALLDQKLIAGIGNIYADEALFNAKISPLTSANLLSDIQYKELAKAIRLVLNRGIETKGTSLGIGLSNYSRITGDKGDHQHRLDVFRKTHQPCPRCKTPIKRIIVAQRSTHFCPHCQK